MDFKASSKDDLIRLTGEYLDTKALQEKVTKRMDELKMSLGIHVDTEGFTDDKGNKWLPVGTRQLKREKRVSKSFDEAAAIAWCKEHGIYDDVKKVVTIETIDEDKLLAYAWENREHSSTIESFNVEKVTWAFKVVEKRSFDDES